jgi:hypothetical protein
MKFANATNLDRKSGVAHRRDLQSRFRAKRNCRGRTAPDPATPSGKTAGRKHFQGAIPRLRSGDKLEDGSPTWHGWRGMDRVNQRGSPDLPRYPLTLSIDY